MVFRCEGPGDLNQMTLKDPKRSASTEIPKRQGPEVQKPLGVLAHFGLFTEPETVGQSCPVRISAIPEPGKRPGC